MIKVLLIAGIVDSEWKIKQQAIPYEVPYIPQIGSMILPNLDLHYYLSEKKRAWGVNEKWKINYVVSITYLGNTPVIMLGPNPLYYTVYLMYGDKSRKSYLKVIPRTGDEMYVPAFEDFNLVVYKVIYTSESTAITIWLVRD